MVRRSVLTSSANKATIANKATVGNHPREKASKLSFINGNGNGRIVRDDLRSRDARLCVDYSQESSFQAIDILRDVGFKVYAAPVNGIPEPQLTLGSTTYHGIMQIRELANSIKKR
jgi:hypothetical protein